VPITEVIRAGIFSRVNGDVPVRARDVGDDDDDDRARVLRLLGVQLDDPEAEAAAHAAAEWHRSLAGVDAVPDTPDRGDVALWERETSAATLPTGPPWDVPERLAWIGRDVAYLVDTARTYYRLAKLWHDRHQQQQEVLRKLVMAADRGGSLTAHLEAARELLPKTRYKRPPR
jgi:hypothetical protein